MTYSPDAMFLPAGKRVTKMLVGTKEYPLRAPVYFVPRDGWYMVGVDFETGLGIIREATESETAALRGVIIP